MARDLVLALVEREPGQPAHVLAGGPRSRRRCPRSASRSRSRREPRRAAARVGLGPAAPRRGVGRRREVGRPSASRTGRPRSVCRTSGASGSCSACVFAKSCAPAAVGDGDEERYAALRVRSERGVDRRHGRRRDRAGRQALDLVRVVARDRLGERDFAYCFSSTFLGAIQNTYFFQSSRVLARASPCRWRRGPSGRPAAACA